MKEVLDIKDKTLAEHTDKPDLSEANLKDTDDTKQPTMKGREWIANYIKGEIKDKDFFAAYMIAQNHNNGDFTNLDFMKEVVKAHGANGDILRKAVHAVSNIADQSLEFEVKLLNDTLKTPEYREAFEKKQDKAQDYTM